MQIAISMEAGHVASPVILRKLSNNSRSNRVYAAARELGRVMRTIYLLRWINSKEMRQEVTGQTNKIEQYHAFTKWLDFGGGVWENDPNEQQKALRNKDIVASAVMLHNTVDTMMVIENLIARGYPVKEEDFPWLSPYGQHTKRFGAFVLDPKKPVEPWLKDTLYRQAARQARANAESVGKDQAKGKGRRGQS